MISNWVGVSWVEICVQVLSAVFSDESLEVSVVLLLEMQDLDWTSVDVLDLIVYSFLYAQLNMFIEVMTEKKYLM